MKRGKAILEIFKGINRAGHFVLMPTMLFLALTAYKFRRASRQMWEGNGAKALEPSIISRPVLHIPFTVISSGRSLIQQK